MLFFFKVIALQQVISTMHMEGKQGDFTPFFPLVGSVGLGDVMEENAWDKDVAGAHLHLPGRAQA